MTEDLEVTYKSSPDISSVRVALFREWSRSTTSPDYCGVGHSAALPLVDESGLLT